MATTFFHSSISVGVQCVAEMSKNRFKEIKHLFHLADNSNLRKDDEIAKIRPLMELLLKNLKQFGIFFRKTESR